MTTLAFSWVFGRCSITNSSRDAATRCGSIWWLDGRGGPLEPPVTGAFDHGIDTFYADDTLRGLPIRVRFTWSGITAASARCEQAFSPDAGVSWAVN